MLSPSITLMFKKILIANRGEIACRIMRTAQKMGIQCVAIYSTEDTNALHVKLADEAYWVGPSEARLSYLNQQAILRIAKRSHSEAIHPGYGFLSENADFAEACEQQAIIFIGAPSAAIRAMGSKIAAKQLMAAAGIPLLPGYHGGEQSADVLLTEAQKIGFPVLIKASAGGGGKGMRTVYRSEDFLDGLAECKRVAKTAFGSDDVLLEKYLTAPRHIEVQIFADQHGNCIHLFERDCSIQRRHQKIIEEAPAMHLSTQMRSEMGAMAIRAAQSVNYIGAGTIEFLYDQEHFYFMEMNTRLQVEHPVTEAITGQDLVSWQLTVASGLALPLTQAELSLQGHAIEVRLYAEDADHGFLPSTGTIEAMLLPPLSLHVRLDSGIQQGDKIGIFYDPMLAKLICFGQTRAIACQAIQQALKHCTIAGLKTNLNFLNRLVNLPAFQTAHITTHFIEQHQAELHALNEVPTPLLLAIAAVELTRLALISNSDPWQTVKGWQNGLTTRHTWDYTWQDKPYTIIATADNPGWAISINGTQHYQLHAWQQTENHLQLRFNALIEAHALDEQCLQVALLSHKAELIFLYQNQAYPFSRVPRFQAIEKMLTNENQLLAPMPGKIIALLCDIDQAIVADQPLLIMEAMKMEHTIRAPKAGILKGYLGIVGSIVNEGDLLVDIAS